MGPAAAGSPLQKASMIEVTPGELFRRHMFYTHYQVDARLVRDYYFKSGDTIAWLQDMGVEFNSVRPAFRARERTRAYSDGEYTWHVVQPEDGLGARSSRGDHDDQAHDRACPGPGCRVYV